MSKYRFTSEEVNFEGEDGYFVKQYREDGQLASGNFVGKAYYEDFCKAIGVCRKLRKESVKMHDSKVRRMSVDMECEYLTEDSKVRVYLSPVRGEKKETVVEKAVVIALELFYSLAVTYFIGSWAIAAAYAERDYKAYGGEYLLIIFVFGLSFHFIRKFFENFRR